MEPAVERLVQRLQLAQTLQADEDAAGPSGQTATVEGQRSTVDGQTQIQLAAEAGR
jgi:hypothetical protein